MGHILGGGSGGCFQGIVSEGPGREGPLQAVRLRNVPSRGVFGAAVPSLRPSLAGPEPHGAGLEDCGGRSCQAALPPCHAGPRQSRRSGAVGGGHCHLRGPSRVLRGAPFPASAPASRPGPLAHLRSWHLLPYRAPFFAVISGGGEGLCVVHRPEPEVFVQRLRITSLWGSQRDRCRAGGGFLRDGNSP